MVNHPSTLRRYQAAPGQRDARAVLVKRTDPEFVPGLLDGLRQSLDANALGAPESRHEGFDRLHLFQPIHRTFNLLLIEAACGKPTFPRLDPRKIESAGLVVRRVGHIPAPTALAGRSFMDMSSQALAPGLDLLEWSQPFPGEAVLFSRPQAWTHNNGTPIGWQTLSDPDLDPDPDRRRRVVTANPRINSKLAELLGLAETAAERVAPMFVAPPDVCNTVKRTILYGVVPVTSSESAAQPELPTLTDEDVLRIMPSFLRALGGSGRPAVSGDVTPSAIANAVSFDPTGPLAKFSDELRLIQFGWGAFETGGEEILNLLNQIEIHFLSPDRRRPLGEYLSNLCAFAIARTDSTSAHGKLPDEWPQPSAALASQLRDAVRRRLQARLAESAPPGKRFDDERAVYEARAFVRAYCQDGCPPQIHWSDPSPPFTIAPWWEKGGPVHTIPLPDLDQESVKKLKPNVAFTLPASLAGLLNNTPADQLQKGGGSLGGPGIGWICSFSLPAITLCAFIVLNIFLTLFNIIFQWLFFIKICLPFPKPPPPSDQ